MTDFNENNQTNTAPETAQPQQPQYQPPQYTQQYQQQYAQQNGYQPPNYYAQTNTPPRYTQPVYQQPVYQPGAGYPQKSRIAAAMLAFLFGTFGVHNFYTGNTGKGVAQILLGTLGSAACGIGPIISMIWAISEGIQLLKDTVPTDGHGVPFID